MTLVWIIAAVVAVVVVISVAQARAGRGTYRRLSSYQPQGETREKTPLGTEAIDHDLVAQVARRNNALERSHNIWSRRGSGPSHGPDTLPQFAKDETYARQYYRAFTKNTDRTPHDDS